MTLDSCIQSVDEIKPNAFSNETKTKWINEVEGMVQTEVFLMNPVGCVQYTYEKDKNATLLVDDSYDLAVALGKSSLGIFVAHLTSVSQPSFSQHDTRMFHVKHPLLFSISILVLTLRQTALFHVKLLLAKRVTLSHADFARQFNLALPDTSIQENLSMSQIPREFEGFT